MDYEKKYKEALSWIKDVYPTFEGAVKEDAEHFFPELKESEDERIRKEIIRLLHKGGYMSPEDKEKAFAWLEKQSEQKEINLVEILKHYPRETELYSPLHGKLWLAEVDEEHEIITCYKHQLDEGCVRAILEQEDTVSFYSNGTTGLPDFSISKDCMLFLYDIEKQGEQKSVNYADEEIVEAVKDTSVLDMVEPKFKAGQWIVDIQDGEILHINKVLEYAYEVTNLKGGVYQASRCSIETWNRLWTIQDAKNGDVLVDNYGNICIYQEPSTKLMYHSYCYGNNKHFIDGEGSHVIVGTYPATKEQRDLLFQKMKEAGYEWDAKKKELKKVEQKPAWSEEDAEFLRRAIKATTDVYPMTADWLKSLKGRVQPQWKPSEEHIRYLQAVVNDVHNIGSESCCIALRDLLEQLKKL